MCCCSLEKKEGDGKVKAETPGSLKALEETAKPPSPVSRPSPFAVEWNPDQGRGRVIQTMANGDRYVLCLQCRYPGYSGGLWAGSMSESGLLWIPAIPIPGFKALNIFCAQDESIFDEDEKLEIDSGWSENFGRGDDGLSFDYVEGQIVQHAPQKDLILRSVNRRDCYELTRHLLWPLGKAYLVISTSIRNLCDHPKHFSFWTGEDPWIGRYKSSDGDVGWYSGGIVNKETFIEGKNFKYGGLYDLGNELLGQQSKDFSNVADFIALDPAQPPPDAVFFANSFAHKMSDIDTNRPLDNKSLTAFNLGWTGIKLKAGEKWRLHYVLGRALSARPGEAGVGDLPSIPEIGRDEWDFVEKLKRKRANGDRNASPIRFVAETIKMTVEPPLMRIDATYTFKNRSGRKRMANMFYPFLIDETHPYPEKIDVEGAPFRKHESGVIWKLKIGVDAEKTVAVSYTQRCNDGKATYILTSTHVWEEPLADALYEVRWPEGLKNARLSLEGEVSVAEGYKVLRTHRKQFMPDRDLVFEWGE